MRVFGTDGVCRWPAGRRCFGFASEHIYLAYRGAEYWPSEGYVCPRCADLLVDFLLDRGVVNGKDCVFARDSLGIDHQFLG